MQVARDKWLLFGGILAILIGLVMLIAPSRFIQLFWILIGIAVILEGFVTLFSVRPDIADPRIRRMLLIRGILGIAVGLLAVFLPLFTAGTVWTVMVYILAIEMIVSAVMECFVIRDMRSLGLPVRDYVIEAIFLIVIAVILLLFPLQLGTVVVRIIGVIAIIGGCVGLYRWKKLGA